MPAPTSEIRLLIVEDVPQVAQYIRTLLSSQTSVKLLDVVTEGAKAVQQVEQLRPDVVIVDALLQGQVKGPTVVEQINRLDPTVPVIALTVPQQPVEVSPANGVHAVLSMPFSGFEMFTKIKTVYASFHSGGDETGGRVVTVFAPKGGVGKTTIAFNLAVALSQLKEPHGPHRRQPPVRRPADAPQGAGRRAVHPRPAHRPDPGIRPARRAVARPLGDRHPPRPAADRDGRDGHGPGHRQGVVAAATGLSARSWSTCPPRCRT